MSYHFEDLLELPKDVVVKTATKKRDIAYPNLDSLSKEQREAYNGLVEFAMAEKGGMTTLAGYAGTGKSYLISRFVEWYLETKEFCNVAMTAPTNKAVKVMKDMAEYQNERLTYKTIHSLLGLKEKISHDGTITYEQDRSIPPSIDSYRMVIIDEASMLNDELFELLKPYIRKNNMKYVFVGDPAQIPPVGHKDSIPMDEAGRGDNNISYFHLSTIQRQAEGNPIIELSMNVRNDIHRGNFTFERKSLFTDEMDGIQYFVGNRDGEMYHEVMEAYFKSGHFKSNPDFMKIIAWRNKTVDTLNAIVRKMIYGEGITKIMVGEKMLANSPIIEGEKILFTTNDDFEVIDFSKDSMPINDGQFHIGYYDALVQYNSPLYGLHTHRIKIVDEDSEPIYKQILEILKQVAIAEPIQFKRVRAWQEFYKFQENFADVKYNYAITAHKSQGSTYENCMVFENDIVNNRNVNERNRILYTAFTRPKHKLFIVL